MLGQGTYQPKGNKQCCVDWLNVGEVSPIERLKTETIGSESSFHIDIVLRGASKETCATRRMSNLRKLTTCVTSQINNLRYTLLIARRSRPRRRLTRQLLITHRRVVNKRRHDRRGLLHIIRLNPIEYVLVRVVRARVVFDFILDELKSRQADAIERLMVRAARVRNRNRAGAHIAEGHQPLSEKISEGAIALQVDTANFSGAVIQIEIARELFIVRQCRQLRRRSIRVAASATTAELSRASFE